MKRLKARAASDDAFKNELGRKTFSRFDDVLAVKSPAGDPFGEGRSQWVSTNLRSNTND